MALAGLVSLMAVAVSAPPALADEYRDRQWYLRSLQVADVHRTTKGAGVTVAVLDTGVRADHPDLKGAVLPGTDVLAGGGNGHDDLDGHGTAMAGIIAARGRGSSGQLGMAPEAKILPVKSTETTRQAILAVDWAVEHGAKVICMSFGVLPSENLAAAVAAAAAADVVLVGAVGNSADEGNPAEYPAAYPEVLAVGSVDEKGWVPAFSQQGPQVDLVAPGVGMLNIDLDYDTYAISRGTSDSAAVVAGAAALIRSKNPDLSAAQVVEVLTSTAKDGGPKGRDDAYGFGQLDLVAAVNARAPAPAATTDAPAATGAPAAGGSAPSAADDSSGIPAWAFVAAGTVLLVGAVIAVLLMLRRPGRVD